MRSLRDLDQNSKSEVITMEIFVKKLNQTSKGQNKPKFYFGTIKFFLVRKS